MSGIDGKAKPCVCIGDLPLLVKANGKFVKILLRNVRCVPEFTETLISVDQLWCDSGVDSIFRDRCVLLLPTDGEPFEIPFARKDKLFQLDALPTAEMIPSDILASASGLPANLHAIPAHAFHASAHGPRAQSHFSVMSADAAITALHRRLHLGYDRLRKMVDIASDVPPQVAKGLAHSCAHCFEANAARLSHSAGSIYKPSHAGRLIHADLAGPFKLSAHGHYRYFLVMVDDHTRYKQVYFMKEKSEVAIHMRKFVPFQCYGQRGQSYPHTYSGFITH